MSLAEEKHQVTTDLQSHSLSHLRLRLGMHLHLGLPMYLGLGLDLPVNLGLGMHLLSPYLGLGLRLMLAMAMSAMTIKQHLVPLRLRLDARPNGLEGLDALGGAGTHTIEVKMELR